MKETIRRIALDSGYILAGFSGISLESEDRNNLLEYSNLLENEMSWFMRYSDIRIHPEKIMEGARSVLVLALPYLDSEYDSFIKNSRIKISRYAAGKDYHKLLRKMGARMLHKIKEEFPQVEGRVTADSAPVPEKILARYSGIGWQGKHTNMIHPDFGSYFFISCIFLNVEIEPDTVMKDRCGNCRKCIDACPTEALGEYRIDAKKCISYLTIEKKESIPEEYHGRMNGWIFGCDICQEVCPYNLRDRIHDLNAEKKIIPEKKILDFLESLNLGISPFAKNENARENFDVLTQGSPVRRAGFEKLVENITITLASE